MRGEACYFGTLSTIISKDSLARLVETDIINCGVCVYGGKSFQCCRGVWAVSAWRRGKQYFCALGCYDRVWIHSELAWHYIEYVSVIFGGLYGALVNKYDILVVILSSKSPSLPLLIAWSQGENDAGHCQERQVALILVLQVLATFFWNFENHYNLKSLCGVFVPFIDICNIVVDLLWILQAVRLEIDWLAGCF
ncbi:unnamed protein product [Absidia cylindrospora]